MKRVIGVAGDTIECCDEQGRLMVNGQPIDEDDFIEPQKDAPKSCDGPMPSGQMDCHWTAGPVPAGKVFVMGDNRDDSADSSVHLCRPNATKCDADDAYVPIEDVVGKVFALAWPLGRAHIVHTPDAFDDVPDARLARSPFQPVLRSVRHARWRSRLNHGGASVRGRSPSRWLGPEERQRTDGVEAQRRRKARHWLHGG